VDTLEIIAFLAQASHETTGGWSTAPGGPQAWGFCSKQENGCEDGKCTQYTKAGNPCEKEGFDCTPVPGQTYFGRGPLQLSWNYNYGYFSKVFLGDASILVADPDRVSRDPVLSYQTALWFWMTPQEDKPSCHAVMNGTWTPSAEDKSAGRKAGFGLVTDIINGGIECNIAVTEKQKDRVLFYKRYAGIVGVSIGEESLLYCDNMQPY